MANDDIGGFASNPDHSSPYDIESNGGEVAGFGGGEREKVGAKGEGTAGDFGFAGEENGVGGEGGRGEKKYGEKRGEEISFGFHGTDTITKRPWFKLPFVETSWFNFPELEPYRRR